MEKRAVQVAEAATKSVGGAVKDMKNWLDGAIVRAERANGEAAHLGREAVKLAERLGMGGFRGDAGWQEAMALFAEMNELVDWWMEFCRGG